jgi:hypothetical protein
LIHELIVPLVNLHREESSILDLGDSAIIHKNELPQMAQNFIQRTSGLQYDSVLKMPSRDGEEFRLSLDRALTIFKLFKDSIVLSNCIFEGAKLVDCPPHYVHWIDQHRGIPPYDLPHNEESEFADFWKEFAQLPPTDFAVYRFHLADYRAYSSDRFADYVESLEYLLVPDSDEGEISYKFRSRATLILGRNRNSTEREGLLSEFKQAYRLRSAIVHGDKEEETKLVPNGRWEERTRPMRCHDREAIKYFFRAKCLDNQSERINLLKKKLILEAAVE